MSTIYCNGTPVPRVDDTKYYFHNRLTCIYGGSGTGKSALTQHILNSLKDVIPLVIVACPTASMNGDYNNIVPDQCIYDDMTKPLIQKIFQRQQNVVTMYQMVHDHRHLSKLFYKVADEPLRSKVAKLAEIYKKGCNEMTSKLGEDEVESAIEDLTGKYHKKLVKIMRHCINDNLVRLNQLPLTDIQQSLISNFNLNPSLLLIADDCMASVKEWGGLEETKKLFYQGRHYHISSIILVQAVTLLPTQFRINAHINIFTTESVTNSYINKAAAGISAEDKKKTSKIAANIFAPSNDKSKPNYKKLVVFGAIIKTEHKIQYIIGSPRKKRFGSAALWAMCHEIQQNSSTSLNNSFNKMFSLKANPSME